MKKVLLVYKTKTGFTKRYADWISEEIICDTITLKEMTSYLESNYDIIIYGAGMHAGRINGLRAFKNKVKIINSDNKKIIVFTIGGTPYKEEVVEKIKEGNFIEDEKEKIEFFYFQSGIDYKKMGFLDKIIMKTYSRILQLKDNKTDLENGTSQAIITSYDYSSKEFIKPMINYLNKIINH